MCDRPNPHSSHVGAPLNMMTIHGCDRRRICLPGLFAIGFSTFDLFVVCSVRIDDVVGAQAQIIDFVSDLGKEKRELRPIVGISLIWGRVVLLLILKADSAV